VIILLFAIFRIGANWTIFYNSSKTILSTDNWLWLAGCWVFLKLIHESAHAIVCKRYDGTVREAGIIFILFAPLPYVDVTSCWNFLSRMARMHVAAAGLYIVLLIAAIAACVWGHSSQAWLNQLYFNVVVAASVSSLLFNLNPLMKINGRIVTRNLESKRGTYVNQGDTIISIGDDGHKELHVAVAQNDLEHFMKTPGQTVMIHIPQKSLLSCPIENFVPRATVTLNHPALAASWGGDLPVKPVSSNDTQNEFELLEPRFNIIVSIATDKCSELRAGQRVAVTCRPTSYSIGQYLQKSVSDWFYNRLDQ